jgi:hypothetical protein
MMQTYRRKKGKEYSKFTEAEKQKKGNHTWLSICKLLQFSTH